MSTLLIITLICAYISLNLVIANVLTKDEMIRRFITGQNIVGMLVSNIFYSPAWLLKLIRYIVIKFIK